MLTNREKRLIYILLVVVIASGVGLFFFFRAGDLNNLEKEIATMTENIRKIKTSVPDEKELMATVQELNEKIESEKNRFYRTGEIELNEFSVQVTDMIKKYGLSVEKRKTIDNRDNKRLTYLEFSLLGSAYQLSRFLKAISQNAKYWSILELGVKNAKEDGKRMDITLRIMYETNSDTN